MADMTRGDILDEAKAIITKDRNKSYGEPERNFQKIADLWGTYLGPDANIEPHDVAVMLALVKVARISVSPDKIDHWVDLAGYAGCGGEIRPKS